MGVSGAQRGSVGFVEQFICTPINQEIFVVLLINIYRNTPNMQDNN